MYKLLIIPLSLLLAFGFADPGIPDFTQVDEHARKLNRSTSYELTAERLAEPFATDIEKARSIFIWITDNIKYDVQKFKKQQQGPKQHRVFYDASESLEDVILKKETRQARDCFNKGKGVCEDYAYLYKYMCAQIGIEAVFIPGHGRFSPASINREPQTSNHAWNGVKLEDRWYLLDATWAAGNTNMEKGSFTREYKEGFFMTPPERFLLSHFPDDPAWQLMDPPVDREQFAGLPYGWPALSALGITDYSPKAGVIPQHGGTVELRLEFSDPKYQIFLVENQKGSRLEPVKENNALVFTFDPKKAGNHEITLTYLEGKKLKPIISYRVF